MLTEIPNFRAGDTVTWMKTSSTYPATDGWTAKYRITSAAGKKDVTATSSDSDYLFTIAPADSGSVAAATYTFAGWVEKGSGPTLERHTLWTGTITVSADIAAAGSAQELRTFARQNLDKVEAAIASYSVRPVLELEIAGRRIIRPSLSDLMKLRSQLLLEVQEEENLERITAGVGSKKVLGRISATS